MAKYYFDPQDDYYDRDCPINLEWRALGMAEALGLPSAPDAGYERMRDMLLANLWLAEEGGKALSYSRHKEFYELSRYRPIDYTYRNILRVVAEIVETGLALENRTKPGHRGRQSTLTATPALYSPGTVQDDLVYEPGESIILRSREEDRALINYSETLRTRRMKYEMAAVREMHASTVIGLPGAVRVGNHLLFERLVTDRYGHLQVKRQFVRMVPGNSGRRIFSEKWSLHGRLYLWPQNVPNAARASITINGEPTVELDYRAMHALLAYNEIGVKFDGDDPYDVGGRFDRKEVKAAMMIAFNAADEDTAVKALARAKRLRHDRCRQIFDAIRQRHRPIEGAFFTDYGVKLMNIDATIAMAVTTGLMADGIHSIPVHDSIIGPAQFRGQIHAKMEEVWERFSCQLNPCSIK